MSAPIPMLDLKAQYVTIKEQIKAAVDQVFEDQAFILGPAVAKAEKELAAFLAAPHALGVSSGTDAILLALMALGIKPGDGVITTPFTFFATAGCIVRLGAMPIYVDIDPASYNLDPKLLARVLDSKTLPAKPKAIMPVHLFGQPADMDPINELARAYDLKVIEDAAQTIGTIYPSAQGRRQVGSLGHVGCFSFFPSKNLGGAGDGGLITCADQDLADKMRSMRTHGSHPAEKYRHIYVGGNFRLDALQAAVISVKLPYLNQWSAGRRHNAAEYDRLFRQCGLVDKGLVSTPQRSWPQVPESHVFNQYVIRVKQRADLMARLGQEKIGHAVYYPIAMHLLECFAYLGGKPGDLPQAEKAAEEVLALPVYPELTTAQRERIVEVIADFYK